VLQSGRAEVSLYPTVDVLQCVAMCCSIYCTVLHCVALCCTVDERKSPYPSAGALQCVAVCCSVLQRVAVNCIGSCRT